MIVGEAERQAFLSASPGWELDGETIRRTFAHADFTDAIVFVTRLAFEAEKADHHPDIDIRWNKVRIALTTHSENGLTQKDLDLAAAIDAIASA
jgi:4a-hydroxytetrahydrobiopterin dehydratase